MADWPGVLRPSVAPGFGIGFSGSGFCRYIFAFVVGFVRRAVAVSSVLRLLVLCLVLGLLPVAAFSCLCLLARVRRATTTLLN